MANTPKFAHVVLTTTRLTAMRDWYCTVLDAHVVYENEGLCFITFDEEHHRLAFVTAPEGALIERPPNSAGLMHTAYTFPNLGALLDRYATLKRAGIEPQVPIQHGVTTSLYYRDPDGQFVEMQIDNFESADDATNYMRGDEFANDPIGLAFDPQQMFDDYHSGVPEQTLKTRAWALAGPPMPHPMELFAKAE